jgi:bacteriorhodopsin
MEGAGVKLINTDGMAYIGPGSEWFWTAVSGIVLAITFLAIYRQLALARGANAFTHLGALVAEWEGERLGGGDDRIRPGEEVVQTH